MIRYHLFRLIGERKVKVADVARETGLNRSTMTLLNNEATTRVELDVIERLCVLFGCEVQELLEWSRSSADLD